MNRNEESQSNGELIMDTAMIENTGQLEIIRNMMRNRGYSKEETTRDVVIFSAATDQYFGLTIQEDKWLHVEAGFKLKALQRGAGFEALVAYLKTLPKDGRADGMPQDYVEFEA